jgi:hypothetical protein
MSSGEILIGFFKHFAYDYDTHKHTIQISKSTSWGNKKDLISELPDIEDEYLEIFISSIP